MYMNQFQACLRARFEPTWKTQTDSVNTKASSLILDTVQQLCYAETWNWFISGWEKKCEILLALWAICCWTLPARSSCVGQPTHFWLTSSLPWQRLLVHQTLLALKLIDPLALGYWTVALSLPVHVTVTCSYNHINTFIIQSKYFSISDWLKSHR